MYRYLFHSKIVRTKFQQKKNQNTFARKIYLQIKTQQSDFLNPRSPNHQQKRGLQQSSLRKECPSLGRRQTVKKKRTATVTIYKNTFKFDNSPNKTNKSAVATNGLRHFRAAVMNLLIEPLKERQFRYIEVYPKTYRVCDLIMYIKFINFLEGATAHRNFNHNKQLLYIY